MASDDSLRMTQDEYGRLEAHVKTLQQQLKDALKAMGDGAESDSNTWHDNAAFDEATQKVDAYTREFGEARSRLNRAVIVASASVDKVGVGSTVTLMFTDDGPETFRIGGDHVVGGIGRDDGIKVLSSSSPLGGALLGKKKGEAFKYATPRGRSVSGEVINIS